MYDKITFFNGAKQGQTEPGGSKQGQMGSKRAKRSQTVFNRANQCETGLNRANLDQMMDKKIKLNKKNMKQIYGTRLKFKIHGIGFRVRRID